MNTTDKLMCESLGAVIKLRRRDVGMMLTTLADAAGISRGYATDIESGRNRVSVSLLGRIAGILGVSAADLFAAAAALPIEPPGQASGSDFGAVARDAEDAQRRQAAEHRKASEASSNGHAEWAAVLATPLPQTEPAPTVKVSQLEPGKDTVAELVAAYLKDQRHEMTEGSFNDRVRTLGKFAAAFGTRSPESLRSSEVREWLVSRSEWVSDTTRWGALNLIRRLISWALEDRRLMCSPIRGLRMPPPKRREATTSADYQLMLQGSTPLFRRFLVFMAHTGCRPGEARAILWDWVCWKRGIISIPAAYHKAGKATGRPRVIVLTITTMRLLQWLRKRCDGTGHVFQNKWGEAWTREALGQRLARLREEAGVSNEGTLHGLRHRFATDALLQSKNIVLTSKLLGHGNTAVTERYYVHVDDQFEHLRATAELGTRRNGAR
jgi:integrase/transcriptional regulator with XRE-family HTH domain